MTKKLLAGIAILGIVGGVTGEIPVSAASTSLPWDDPNSNVEVGGPGGLYAPTTCSFSGFNFRDTSDNSFDNGGLVKVDGTYIGNGATTFDLTGVSGSTDALATYPETDSVPVGDLGVSVSYRITSGNIVRTMVTITNNGATDAIDVPVSIESSVVSGARAYHVDGGSWRSSGDWFVMAEADNPPSQPDPSPNHPPSFHAPDGPGSPESPATVASCDGTPRNLQSAETGIVNDHELVFGYGVDIPAGATRRIVVIQGFGNNLETVTSLRLRVESFDPSGQTPGNGILSDLSDVDACTVVNWAFEVCGGGGGSDFDIDLDVDIDHYQRRAAEESDLPDTL